MPRLQAGRLALAAALPAASVAAAPAPALNQKIATWNRSVPHGRLRASRVAARVRARGPAQHSGASSCFHGRGASARYFFLRATLTRLLRTEAAALPIGQVARVLAAERGGAPEAAFVAAGFEGPEVADLRRRAAPDAGPQAPRPFDRPRRAPPAAARRRSASRADQKLSHRIDLLAGVIRRH